MKLFSTHCILALVLAGAAASAVVAQEFPARPVSLVVPFPAGGPSDLLARAVAQRASQKLGQQVVVENVGGAGGSIGSAKAARSAPDGYTLLFGTIGTHVANVALYKSLPYDPQKDFEPVALLGSAPLVLVAKAALPANNFPDFVDYVRKNTDTLTYGSAGAGSISHMGCLILMSEMKTNVQHVPYKGVAPAMTDLMGGQIDFMCDQTTTVIGQLKSGKIKALAALSRERVPQIPGLATAAASGFPAVNVRAWNAVFAPRGVPKPVLDKLVAALQAALEEPEFRKQMSELGVDLSTREQATPDALRTLLATDIAKLVPVLKSKQGYLD